MFPPFCSGECVFDLFTLDKWQRNKDSIQYWDHMDIWNSIGLDYCVWSCVTVNDHSK